MKKKTIKDNTTLNVICLSARKPKNCLPELSSPNSTKRRFDEKTGEVKQIRKYDKDGKPLIDIDFGHDHNGAGDPHAHDWIYKGKMAPNKSRMEARALSEEESKYYNNMQVNNDRISMHDQEISNIKFQNKQLVIRTNDYIIQFIDIIEMKLCNLWIQNIIFDFNVYTNEKEIIIKEIPFDSKDYCKDDAAINVILISSIGINGEIKCKRIIIKKKVGLRINDNRYHEL
jgi:hypothetical protein